MPRAKVPEIGVSKFSILPAIRVDRHGKANKVHRDKPDEMLRKLWCAVEQSPDPVIITDRSGVIEYVNPGFEILTGYSKEQAIGSTPRILRSETEPAETYQEMWKTILSGNTFRGVLVNRKRNGEAFSVEKIITPFRDSAGQITHFISTDRDITERSRLEGELQQARKMDAIGRLAGGVAHDFNNLLMVISSYGELMLDSLSAKHPLRRNVQEIMAASRRATDLTRQLLAFGRKQVQALQYLDLNSMIHDISRMLLRIIGEDIEFVFVPGADIGVVRADPIQIEQVVMNLAGNARDAMPHGGKLTIETIGIKLDEVYLQKHAMVPAGEYVLLVVTDTGGGISAQHLPHIFEPFYTTKGSEGNGLGLATVYGIVKQSAGFVWVYSEAGMGATFKIYLPRVHAEATELPAAGPTEELIPRGCETVLLVEDEAAVRQSGREFLLLNGYNVLEATDGEDALRIAAKYEGTIHLMITDVVMPRLGGAKLAVKLRAIRPEMKVLFVSGYAEITVLRQGAINLSTSFLQKPFSLKALARKIRELLEPSACASAASASSN
jgi:two-component system, cell cycle sensor histidine kinase and response regulator CckA